MTQEAKSIGKLFSDRRQELQLSLKEAESATSIRSSYLEAIEAEQLEKLISPVYAQGFVKQYAAYLGLDGEKIISENAELFRKPLAQEFAFGIGTLETRGSPGNNVKWVPNLLWIIAFSFLALIAFLTAKTLELI